MTMTTIRKKPRQHDPDTMVVALESFVMIGPNGHDLHVQRNEKLRGDDYAVLQNPSLFLPDGLPSIEYRRANAALYPNRPAPD